MADTKITAEVTRTPIDGTELIRLATTGANWKATVAAIVAGTGLLRSNNLSDLANAGTARTSLGLGSLAVLSTIDVAQLAATIYASQADAQGGTENTKIITALRAKQAALAGVGSMLTGLDQISKSVDYTFVLADAGKHIYHPSTDNTARTFTIPGNAGVPFPIGTVLGFVNRVNSITIAITSDTLIFAGIGTTGSRALSANGMASAMKTNTTEWMISGIGLS